MKYVCRAIPSARNTHTWCIKHGQRIRNKPGAFVLCACVRGPDLSTHAGLMSLDTATAESISFPPSRKWRLALFSKLSRASVPPTYQHKPRRWLHLARYG